MGNNIMQHQYDDAEDFGFGECKLGNRRVARLISRYIHFSQQPESDDRTYILEQLKSLAREKNIVLPAPETIKKRTRKRQLVTELVDVTKSEPPAKYKMYYDGENIVAYMCGENATERQVHKVTKWDELFASEYAMLKSDPKYSETNLSNSEKFRLRCEIENEIIRRFYEIYLYDDAEEDEPCPVFVGRKIYNIVIAQAMRFKRFERKKDQTRWTAWFTQTYDDRKVLDEKDFERRLLTYFRHLCNTRHWKIMGVFERGELNGRLHFHGFLYIPEGQNVGELVTKTQYSEKDKRWIKYVENTKFLQKFGKNEYEDIEFATKNDIAAMSKYTMKMARYMEKGARVYYSRHIPTEFLFDSSKSEMICAFNITNKKSIRRYVVNDRYFKRTDTAIERIRYSKNTRPLEIYSRDPCQLSLFDSV